MQTGLDRIGAGLEPELEGQRVALLCNHTAVDRWGKHAADVLREVKGLSLVRLLGPEHGVWSTHQDMETVGGDGAPDPFLGVPTFSLYGDNAASLTPRDELIADVDAVIYDIQDIGTRFYTYAATLAFTMEAAQRVGTQVIVLDRPNPIGHIIEGPLLGEGFESFCGIEAGLPIRHGMNVGALAKWYGARRAPECDLKIVPCDRDARIEWVPPSPNMPTRDTAAVYPGMCLLEGTTLSEGRGTTTPFLIYGAPGVDPVALVNALRDYECPGVDFVPRVFRPEFGKYAGQACGGVYLRVFDPTCLRSVALGVFCLDAIRRVAPQALQWRSEAYEFVEDVPAIDLLWGSTDLRETLEAGGDVEALLKRGKATLANFVP
ncbi:MAG: exo-beta-N-acetylmuramidase NamZ family protein [Myxococcota bacterium]